MRKLLFLLITVFTATLCKATATDTLFTIQGSKGNLAAHLQLPAIKNGEKLPINPHGTDSITANGIKKLSQRHTNIKYKYQLT